MPQALAKSGSARGGVPVSPLDLANLQPSTEPSLGCAVAGPVWANAHFAPAEPMPEPFGAARMLARSGGYAYVEVYGDGLILPVLDDGTVVRP